MGNEMIPANIFGEITPVADIVELEALANRSKFLRRIELKSKGVLIDTGKVKPGHYCIVKNSQDAEDLGDSIDILPLTYRFKAIDMSDTDQIITSFDMKSPLFKEIEQRSSVKDSRCQWGASFLVIERTTAQLYELFLGSKSNRNEVNTLLDFLPQSAEQLKKRNKSGDPHGPLPLTLKSKRVEKKKLGYSWFVMVPRPCSNPFTMAQIPSKEVIQTEKEKFLHPEDTSPEVETGAEGAKRAR